MKKKAIPDQIFPDVPQDKVGEMVQDYVDAGAKKVTVTPNKGDDETFTIVVKN